MLNGVISLIVVQLVLVGLTGGLYLRLRQKADIQGQDVLRWAVKIEAASAKADSAVAQVDKIDGEHYRALKNKYETLALEFDDLKRKFIALEDRYERLKLDKAAEAKAVSRARVAAPGPVAAAGDAEPGPVTIEDLVASGQAFPMGPKNNHQPAPARAASTFGQPAR